MEKSVMLKKVLSLVCIMAAAVLFTASPALADLIWPIPVIPDSPEEYDIDYLVLVNRENPLPETWADEVRTVSAAGSGEGENGVEVEEKTCDAFLALKEALAGENIQIVPDSAYRDAAAQQAVVVEFTERYGEDFVKQYTAEPGYSEHQTGLALDLCLGIDGEKVCVYGDPLQYPEIWAKIHAKLADHGFILRYPEGRENITGFAYEPWHIRFINDPAIAKEIMEKGITLEEYLETDKE